MFLATCFKYCSRGLPMTFFPDIAPSKMLTTNSLCLIICPINEWRLLFKIFRSILPSFTVWKTSSFVILSVHFIFNILLQHHVSNQFMTLSLFLPRNQTPALDSLTVAEIGLSDFRWNHSDSWERAGTQWTGGCINRRNGLDMVAKKKVVFILPGLYPGFAVTLPMEL